MRPTAQEGKVNLSRAQLAMLMGRRNAGQPRMLTLIGVRAIQLRLQILYQIGLGSLVWIRRSVNVAEKGFDAKPHQSMYQASLTLAFMILTLEGSDSKVF